MADYWKPRLSRHGGYFQNWTSVDEAKWKRMYVKWMAFVNEFKNRGGRVTTGTDAGMSFTLYGFSLVQEMELLEEAGFNPLEAIRAATSEAARALEVDDVGQIRPGFRADLVIVDSNPIEDLKVLYGDGVSVFTNEGVESKRGGVSYTIVDGVVYDAKKLLQEVAAIVKGDTKPTTTQ